MKKKILNILNKMMVLLAAAGIAFAFPATMLTVSAAGGFLPRLVDEGDLLSDAEEATLLAKLDAISERQQCDVVIATVDTLGGKDAESFADDYFDYNGYGYGADKDGILLVVCMENRDYAISTAGFGIEAFTDYGLRYIEDEFLPSLSSGYYSDSFHKFADLCDAFLTQARSGAPYDVNNKVGAEPFKVTGGLVGGTGAGALGAGFLGAYGSASRKRKTLTSVAKKTTAGQYIKDFNLTKTEDVFVRTETTSHTSPKSSDTRSGGGSSTHVGSSGTTHGGSSGKFQLRINIERCGIDLNVNLLQIEIFIGMCYYQPCL